MSQYHVRHLISRVYHFITHAYYVCETTHTHTHVHTHTHATTQLNRFYHVAVCCSVLQCVAVCCSVLTSRTHTCHNSIESFLSCLSDTTAPATHVYQILQHPHVCQILQHPQRMSIIYHIHQTPQQCHVHII